jgi:predicted NBD/HSP70 family sugar kinase
MHVVLCNMVGDILGEVQQSYPYPDYRQLLSSATASIDTLVAKVPPKHRDRLLGIGVAHPTYIWQGLGGLNAPQAQMDHWKNSDIAAAIASASSLPVAKYNDGNAACWGEFCAAAHPRSLNAAYLNIGTYVGAGLIVGSKLWEGPTGNSANLGSMSIRDGQGVMRTPHEVASVYAFEKLLEDSEIAIPAGDPDDWDWNALEPVTSGWIESAAKAFSEVIANTTAVLEIDAAIIDGGIPRDVVNRVVTATAAIISEFPARTFQWPNVLAGRLGRSATAVGAALRPVSETYFL